MYHISCDIRAQSSAQLLAASVLQLAEKKPLAEISVAELQRISGVSRSTFYRLFDTPLDVITWQVEKLFESWSEKFVRAPVKKTIALDFMQLMMENATLLEILAKNDQLDLLARSHRHYFQDILTLFDLPPDLDPIEKEYLVDFLSYALPIAIFTWLRRGKKETATEVYHYFWQNIQLLSQAAQK